VLTVAYNLINNPVFVYYDLSRHDSHQSKPVLEMIDGPLLRMVIPLVAPYIGMSHDEIH